MDIVTIIAGGLVVAVGLGLAFSVGRTHRQERHEVENFFTTEQERQAQDQTAWWEERL